MMMHSISVFVVLLVIGTSVALPTRAGCFIDVQNGLGNPQPLILKPEETSNNYEAFQLPTENEAINLDNNQAVLLACPGGTLKVSGTNTKEELGEATCNSGKFQINGKSVSFTQISCSRLPFHTVRYTNATCNGDHREVEIGFYIKTTDRFIRQLTLCFNEEKLITDYSYYTTSKAIVAYQSGFPRPNFIEDREMYPVDVNPFYARNTQRATLNAQVGLSSSSTKYVHGSNDFFMSRGHLAAKADFIFGSQQRATFHYINVAPQWQMFNGRNWNTLEMAIRSYVGSADSWDARYTVYTGTFGVTTLPHEETGEDTPIYLYTKGGAQQLPVPQYYWRVLRNDDNGEAVAFVGINNPYHKDVSDEIICESVCDQLTWLKWKGQDIDQGYSYCCTVEDLRQTITNVPEFEVTGMLT